MKKRLLTVLSAVLLLAMLVPAAVADEIYSVYISKSGGSLNLRKGPGTEYGIEDYVFHGDKVKLVSLGSEWSYVQVLRTGLYGYIKNIYFDGTKKDEEGGGGGGGGGGGSYSTDGYIYSASGKGIRLRADPNTYCLILGVMKVGTKVKVLSYSGAWVQIYVPALGETGWCMSRYVNGTGGGGGGGGGGGTYPTGDSVYHVTGSSVNMRTGPGTGYSIKRSLVRNTAFRVTGQSGNWYQIKTLGKGYTGYISKNYSGAGATAYTTAALNMRTGPGSSYGWIATMPYGSKVSIASAKGNWAYVTYNGKSGYCSLNFLGF